MGGLRFRRSISLGKGVRLNFNKSSIGISAGIPGLRYSVNTNGQSTRSAGIPGTGLYYRSQTRPRRPESAATSRRNQYSVRAQAAPNPQPTIVTPQIAEQVVPKPGFFASETEKGFRQGLVAYLQQDWEGAAKSFESASGSDTRNLSDDFFLGASYVRLHRFADAVPYFEKVVASPQGLPDDLMRRYVPGTLTMMLPITERATASINFDSVGAALILAELYQELSRKSQAIGVVQRLHQIAPEDQVIKLTLADLLYDDNDFNGLVELTHGVENTNDLTPCDAAPEGERSRQPRADRAGCRIAVDLPTPLCRPRSGSPQGNPVQPR